MIKINFEELQRPLSVDEIDFRIQSINNGGYATILAYKDARADINRLNKVCTPLGWKREHTRDNHNCIVSLWCDEKKQWVSKEDTGTESSAEAKKGLASDSFKRACFNLGMGIELYDYPLIQIKLKQDELQETGKTKPKYRASFNLKIKEWKWESEFKDGKITGLRATDEKGGIRFNYGFKENSNLPTLPKEGKLFDGVKAALGGKYTMADIKKKYIITEEVEQLLK